MSSTALYKVFIEVGASQEAATEAAEDGHSSVTAITTGDKGRY